MNLPIQSKRHIRTVPLIPLRDTVVFPHTEALLSFVRRKSTLSVASALQSQDKLVAIFTQKNPKIDDPNIDNFYRIGTLCTVDRTLKNDSDLNVMVRGISRIYLKSINTKQAYDVAEVVELKETTKYTDTLEAIMRHLTTQFKEAVNLGKPVEFANFMRLMSGVSISELVDQVANTLSLTLQDKQQLLETLNTNQRAKLVLEHLAREIKILEIERNIANKTQAKFSKSMKQAVLKERLAIIQKELGENESSEDLEIAELKQAIQSLKLPSNLRKKINKELSRYSKMSIHNPEANYIRTWLDTIIELPWNKLSTDRVALKTAKQVLASDHYGLSEVKERILEYLSVMKLKKKLQTTSTSPPTILCFVGPPGVGKTSIGRSIAKSLRRKFVKVSLGGIRDEAEIKGHRRTYVGAMPGKIIKGIKDAGTNNPVFMLDEIDKLASDHRGDPSSALLEALDPEQNHAFSDHYLDLPYDLSKVMFIATANVLDTIPPALRDRLEVIRFSGYTEVEKYHIVKNHLLDKVRSNNALTKTQFKLSKPVINKIIKSYAREAGVRELERQLNRIARKIALNLVTHHRSSPTITLSNLAKFLGPAKYLPTVREKSNPVGMATGLAWTSAGGDILFIEVSLMPGKGRLKLTGKLGDVMKESAQAALTYVRANYHQLGLKKDFYKSIDIHIHVPEGAVPKDGPSAGVTITTALVSALSGKKVDKTLGMTGEITLRGRVLEIGGLKEKVIAAHSAGLKKIIFPAGNQKDLVKIPQEVKQDLTFYPVKSISEVLAITFI